MVLNFQLSKHATVGTIPNSSLFNEKEGLRPIFLRDSIQNWLDELINAVAQQVPRSDKRLLFPQTYNLTLPTLTHIADQHYCKIVHHPETSEFIIPLVEILSHARDASAEPMMPVSGLLLFQRVFDVGRVVGLNRAGQPDNNTN